MRTLFLALALLASAAAGAQTSISFKTWGAGTFTSEPDDHSTIATETGFIDLARPVKITARISTTNYKLELRRYSRDMALQREVELGDQFPNGPFKPQLALVDEKPYLFFYRYDGDRSQVALYRALLNETSLAIGAPEELMSWKQKSNSTADISVEYNYSKVLISRSPDRSKLLVFHASGLEGNCRAAVYDKDGKRLWTAEHKAPKPKALAGVRSVCVDNEGRVFFGSSKAGNRKNEPDGFVVVMDAQGTDREIALSDQEIYDVLVCAAPDGKVHVAGSFSGRGNLLGVYHALVNPATGTLSPLEVTAFDADFQQNFDAPAFSRNAPGGTGLQLFHMELFAMPDGSVDMAGTASVESNDRRLSMGSSLLNVRFGSGKPVITRVPRFWRSFFSFGLQLRMLPFGNSMLLMYNDAAANLKAPLDAKPEECDYRNVVLAGALIGPTGSVERMVLADRKKDDPLAMPEFGFRKGTSLYMPLWMPKGQGIPGKQTQWAVATAP